MAKKSDKMLSLCIHKRSITHTHTLIYVHIAFRYAVIVKFYLYFRQLLVELLHPWGNGGRIIILVVEMYTTKFLNVSKHLKCISNLKSTPNRNFYSYSPEPAHPLNKEPKIVSIAEAVKCVKSGIKFSTLHNIYFINTNS